MKLEKLLVLLGMLVGGLLVSGCFLDSDDDGDPLGATVNGTVFKGPFVGGGSVNIYAWDSSKTSGKGSRLSAGTIRDNGQYSLRLNSSYSGAVVIEGLGNYKSELDGTNRNSGASIEAIGFVPPGAGTATSVQVEVNPVTHMVAKSFQDKPTLLNETKFQQVAGHIAGNLGFPAGTNLSTLAPIDATTGTADASQTAAIHIGLLLAGIEQSISTTSYAGFVANQLNQITSGSIPDAVQNVIAQGVTQFSTGRTLNSAINSRVASVSGRIGWNQNPFASFDAPSVDVKFATTNADSLTVKSGVVTKVNGIIGALPSQSYTWYWQSHGPSGVSTLISGTSSGRMEVSTSFTQTTSGSYSVSLYVDYGAAENVSDSVTIVIEGGSSASANVSGIIGRSWELAGSQGGTNRFGLYNGQMLFGPDSNQGTNGTTGFLHFSYMTNDDPAQRYLESGFWKLENNEFGLYFSQKYMVPSTGKTLVMTPVDINGGAYTFTMPTTTALNLTGVRGSAVLTHYTHCDGGDATKLTQIKLYNGELDDCMNISAITTSTIALSNAKFHINETSGDTRRVGMTIFKSDMTFLTTKRDTIATMSTPMGLGGTWALDGTSLMMTVTTSYSVSASSFTTVSSALSETSTYTLTPTTFAGQYHALMVATDSTVRAPLMSESQTPVDLEKTGLCGGETSLTQINSLLNASGASSEPAFSTNDCVQVP